MSTAAKSRSPIRFLLFDIGKTDQNGESLHKETYFYRSQKIDPSKGPYHDTLSVLLATVEDTDPELTVTGAKNYIQTSDPDTFNAIIDKIGGRTTLKLSELKSMISQVASQKYNEVFRNLFQDAFVVYGDRVNVRVSDAPQYQKLLDSGRQILPFGELKVYLQENRDLFERFVAARYYDDFAGFEPTFRIRHDAGYDSVTTYRDGSKVTSSGSNNIRIQIFDKAQGGTGQAISSSSFSYRIYVYADGYQSGQAIGSLIRQDHVDQDVVYRIYLSKEAPPAVAADQANILTGTLKNAKGEPISGASIQIADTPFKTTTNPEGRFIFPALKKENVKLSIVDPENGKAMTAKAVYEGKEYALDQIPIKLAGVNEIHQVSLIGGVAAATPPRTTNPAATTLSGGGSGKPVQDTGGEGLFQSGLLWIIIGLLLLVIIGLFVLLMVKKNRKDICRQCGAELGKEMKFCTRCGTPREK